MNIAPPVADRTPAEASLDKLQLLTDRGLQQIAAGVHFFNEGYEELWSGTDEEILARFAAMGFETGVALLQRHQALGQLINPILDERDTARAAAGLPPLSPQRMPLAPGRPLVIDPVNQTFSIAPDPAPEEPEP